MPMIAAGVILLLSAFGIAAAVRLPREQKRKRKICIAVCSAAAVLSVGFILLSLYFGWAVGSQEANEPPAVTIEAQNAGSS